MTRSIASSFRLPSIFFSVTFLVIYGALVALNGNAGELSRFSSGAVIDLHCHVAGIGVGGSGCFVSEGLRHNWRLGSYLRAFGVTEKELNADGDALVVHRLSDRLAGSHTVQAAVVLAVDGVVNERGELDLARTQYYVPNEFVWRHTRSAPHLLFGASINPLRRDALAILSREAARGAVLVKWLPNIQQFDPADRRFIPFYRRLAGLHLPLLVHTGTEHSVPVSRDDLGDPARLELALKNGVTVIAAHAGGAGRSGGETNIDRFIALLGRYPNLYGDISALSLFTHPGHLRRLLRTRGVADRLVFGTDMPLTETLAMSPWYSLFTIGPMNVWRVVREKNPWDETVVYFRALGVPDAVFRRGASLLRPPHPQSPLSSPEGRRGEGMTAGLLSAN